MWGAVRYRLFRYHVPQANRSALASQSRLFSLPFSFVAQTSGHLKGILVDSSINYREVFTFLAPFLSPLRNFSAPQAPATAGSVPGTVPCSEWGRRITQSRRNFPGSLWLVVLAEDTDQSSSRSLALSLSLLSLAHTHTHTHSTRFSPSLPGGVFLRPFPLFFPFCSQTENKVALFRLFVSHTLSPVTRFLKIDNNY